MKRLTARTRSLVVTATIGGIVLLYAFWVFLPTRRAIASMRAELQEKRHYVVETQKQYAEIGALEQELAQTREWVENWKRNSPQRNNLGGFFGRIAEISRDVGTKVERITPEELSEMKSLARHPVRLTVGGNFGELFAFIRELEQIPFTVWINRLRLQGSSKSSDTLICELSLTVFTDNPAFSD